MGNRHSLCRFWFGMPGACLPAVPLLCFLLPLLRVHAQWEGQIYDIPRLEGIIVDGSEKDWSKQGLRVELLTPDDFKPWDVADFDAAMRLGWDKEGLLVLIRVSDDRFAEAGQMNLPHGDSVELFLAPAKGARDMLRFAVAPGGGGAQSELRWRLWDRRGKESRGGGADPVFARELIPSGYILEAKLPWSSMDFQPEPGKETAFQVYANDFDPGEEPFHLRFYPRGGTQTDTTAMRRLRLAEAPGPPVRLAARAGISLKGETDLELRIFSRAKAAGNMIHLMREEALVASAPLETWSGELAATRLALPPDDPGLFREPLQVLFGAQELGEVYIAPELLNARDLLKEAAKVEEAVHKEAVGKEKMRTAAMVMAWADMLEQLLSQKNPAVIGEVYKRARSSRHAVTQLLQALKDFSSGKDIYAGRKGAFLSAYISGADRSAQIYGLYVPPIYKPPAPLPLVVLLHGVGGSCMEMPEREGHLPYFLAVCDGRGQNGYQGLGELDVLEVIADIGRHYTIDSSRVSLAGTDMGGAGVWHVASRHPDRFSAIAPFSGYAEKDFLENLTNTQCWVFHDNQDWLVPVDFSRAAVLALEEKSAPVVFTETSGTGSGAGLHDTPWEAGKWLAESAGVPAPRFLHYTTSTPARGKAYWLDILELSNANAPATVRTRVDRGNRLYLELENVNVIKIEVDRRLFSKSKPLRLILAGPPVTIEAPLPPFFYLRHTGIEDEWTISLKDPRPERPFRPYTAGGLDFLWSGGEPLLIVRPTAGGDETLLMHLRGFCERLSKFTGGEPMPMGGIPIKDDVAVTAEDMQRHNLVIVGPSSANHLLAYLEARLPARSKGGQVVFGEEKYDLRGRGYMLFYYNPEAPRRYIAVFSSPEPAFYDLNNKQLFDIGGRAPCGFSLARLEPWHWVRRVIWNTRWEPDIRDDGTRPIPAQWAEREHFDREIAAAARAATGADFFIDFAPLESGGLIFDKRYARWHDVRGTLDPAAEVYTSVLTGRNLREVLEGLRESSLPLQVWPPVPDSLNPLAKYKIAFHPWLLWKQARQRERNLPGIERHRVNFMELMHHRLLRE